MEGSCFPSHDWLRYWTWDKENASRPTLHYSTVSAHREFLIQSIFAPGLGGRAATQALSGLAAPPKYSLLALVAITLLTKALLEAHGLPCRCLHPHPQYSTEPHWPRAALAAFQHALIRAERLQHLASPCSRLVCTPLLNCRRRSALERGLLRMILLVA